jgi:hypothetical protein
MHWDRDWITRTPKWMLLGAFWIVQAIVLYFGQVFFYISQGSLYVERESDGSISGSISSGLFGSWPSMEDYLDLAFDWEYAIWMIPVIIGFTIAQLIFMLPVRQPGMSGNHGRSVRKSLCIAGCVIGALFFASIFAVLEFLYTVRDFEWDFPDDVPGEPYTTIGAVILFGWLVATPILICFIKPGRKETVLARLSKKLFIGTIVEVALLIPLDVMVRRKTDCYCWAGTYWALTICGFVGVFALGPAVFLPILAKRRKTWYSGHCGVCGYDMDGMPDTPRCPECGTGWKTEPKKTAIEAH